MSRLHTAIQHLEQIVGRIENLTEAPPLESNSSDPNDSASLSEEEKALAKSQQDLFGEAPSNDLEDIRILDSKDLEDRLNSVIDKMELLLAEEDDYSEDDDQK